MDIDNFFQGLTNIFNAGQKEQVTHYLQQSLQQAEDEQDISASITILNEMAGYFRSISKYQEAIASIEKAITLLKEIGHEGSIPYGTTLLNAATAYRASGEKDKALELFMEVFSIFKDKLPQNDHRLAGLLNNIGSIYEENKEYGKALVMLEESCKIMQLHKNMLADTATVQTNMAMILLKLGKQDKALEILEDALNMFKQEALVKGEKRADPHYAAAMAGFGEAYFRMQRYAEAVLAYESALQHLESTFGQNKDYATTCRNCATACKAAGQTEKALAYEEKAAQILERIKADNQTTK